MAQDLNITTTGLSPIAFLSTILFTTFIDTDKGPSKGPKGSKGPKPEALQPIQHTELLEWKQTLSVISIIIITILIIFAILQIKIHKDCYSNFKQGQLLNKSAKTLFILFIIALLMFYVNSIVFTYYIFTLETLSDDSYAYCLIFSMIPYLIGKFAMTSFFIFRLHLVFNDTALKLKKWILFLLIILLTIGTILGCISGIVGPLHLIHHTPDDKRINPALVIAFTSLCITILVDILVMIYYVQRLISVVIMQGEISKVTSYRKSTDGTHSIIVLRKSTAIGTQRNCRTETVELETRKDTESGIDKVRTIRHGDIVGPSVEFQDGEEWEEVTETTVHFDHVLVNTITKSTLLSLIGILTSFWLHLQMLVMAIKGESDGVLFRAIGSFDGAVNVICMYLMFAFAKPYYEIGCKWCHIGMSKCCVCVTKRAVLRAKEAEL